MIVVEHMANHSSVLNTKIWERYKIIWYENIKQ